MKTRANYKVKKKKLTKDTKIELVLLNFFQLF